MARDSVVICNLHFFSDSLYPFVLLPLLAINLRRGFFLKKKKKSMFEFSIYTELKNGKIQNGFLKQFVLIEIEISLSKRMLAEVTVVRNTTAFKKEMPKAFVQGYIIARIFT